MSVGENIKRLRKERNLTQKQLAERIGFPQQRIGQYEKGVRNPKPETLHEIASALGVPEYKLYDSISDFFRKNPGKMLVSDDETGEYTSVLSLGQETLFDETLEALTHQVIDDPNAFHLMLNYNQLNPEGQTIAVGRVEELTMIPKYQKAQKETAPVDADPPEAENKNAVPVE